MSTTGQNWPLRAGVSWTRSPSPVIQKSPHDGAWDSWSSYNPHFAKLAGGEAYRDSQGRYYLYYTATNSSIGPSTDMDETGLARSVDFQAWERFTAPVVPRGPIGSTDAGDASAGTVIYDDGKFHMWYEGNSNVTGSSDLVTINYATSEDGFRWTKFAGNPVVSAGSGGDSQDVYSPSVIKDGKVWRMWYTGHDQTGRFGIMHATAPAPQGPWTKTSENFIFYPQAAVFASEVHKRNGLYYMLYFDSQSLLYATSADGLTWAPAGVLLEPGNAGFWDQGSIYWGTLIPAQDKWHLFYNASAYSQGIGYVTTNF